MTDELKKEAEEYRKEIKSKFFLSEPQLDLSCQGYIDGLKAREKRIAELEQIINDIQNAECTSCTTLGGMQIKIAELEKENAELKVFKKDCVKLTEDNVVMARQRAETSKQLTKAKNLLAKWVELFKPKGGNFPPTPIQVDTEQFLNSEVEK